MPSIWKGDIPLKNLQDFINLIDSEEYETIMFSAKQSMRATNRNSSDAQAYFIAMELLKRYHNWLNQD